MLSTHIFLSRVPSKSQRIRRALEVRYILGTLNQRIKVNFYDLCTGRAKVSTLHLPNRRPGTKYTDCCQRWLMRGVAWTMFQFRKLEAHRVSGKSKRWWSISVISGFIHFLYVPTLTNAQNLWVWVIPRHDMLGNNGLGGLLVISRLEVLGTMFPWQAHKLSALPLSHRLQNMRVNTHPAANMIPCYRGLVPFHIVKDDPMQLSAALGLQVRKGCFWMTRFHCPRRLLWDRQVWSSWIDYFSASVWTWALEIHFAQDDFKRTAWRQIHKTQRKTVEKEVER